MEQMVIWMKYFLKGDWIYFLYTSFAKIEKNFLNRDFFCIFVLANLGGCSINHS